MAKSDRMYGASPSIKRGDSGMVGIFKPSPSTMDDMGLRGATGSDGQIGEMDVDAKQKEREVLYSKHDMEIAEVNAKHRKEQYEMQKRHNGLMEISEGED